MLQRKDGRRRWTIRQKEILTDVFGGDLPSKKELADIQRLLKFMRGHKQAEQERKRKRIPRKWPTKRK